ncbi:hypothetical protein SYNTR_0031 [Candidatus Syntrophocurvum alkaliphilum]|uniref:Fibronectin type-III domain-containing protein n=1 Tax=Candidatus Syntrophocurvum alkaliphilum TaxID=2293317 RepID=A0A6I6DAS7_9FIRM|nr:Ig-like domain-containing protein [Candidatus Syntrophocurvum alkaliphilum]QGT98624.1 hypothetical protein SYNTR_0031 [Candidatus Syntrophocurvum alkaliphilum]
MSEDFVLIKLIKKYYKLAIIAPIILLLFFTIGFFYMGDIPTVKTQEVNVERTSATLNGMIVDDGGKEITQYGFRWGTSSDNLQGNETISGKITTDSIFNVNLYGLQPGNTYYYKAYAVNSKGSGNGEVKSFIVPGNNPPEVSIDKPYDGYTVTEGDLVNIAATAKDEYEIEAIELFINDESKLKEESDALSYSWDTSDFEPGTYSIKVTAFDGLDSGEKAVEIIVEEKPVVEEPKPSEQTSQSSSNNTSSSTSREATSTVSRGTTDYSTYSQASRVNGAFGQFHYRHIGGGRIEIDPVWVQENIVTITLPGLNRQVQVHKDAADNFIYAFTLIKNGTANINGRQVPLLSLIDTMDGTWVPRHVNWNPSRGLSNHSWGTAIDINAAGNFRYVCPINEPNHPNLILWEKAFKPAGFSWGNRFNDAMHYEIIR